MANNVSDNDRWSCEYCTTLNKKDYLCCEVCLLKINGNDDDNMIAAFDQSVNYISADSNTKYNNNNDDNNDKKREFNNDDVDSNE